MIRILVRAHSLALAVACLSLTGCSSFEPTPLMKASERGDTAMVEKLLEQGANVNAVQTSANGWTALHYAARKGQAEAVRLLIRRGADVNARNGFGHTAMEVARIKGHENVVQAILEETGRSQAPPKPAPKVRPVPTEPEPPPPAG